MRNILRNTSRKLAAAIQSPGFAINYFLGMIMPGVFRRWHIQRAITSGLSGKYLLLSFDCDTEKDIEVVEGVHKKLISMGITPSYAVPGELLIKGAKVYKSLAESGAEFINHGYLSHTQYVAEDRSYLSNVFYHELSDKEVRNDIVQGHKVCTELFGKSPEGFRTPHFGTYQSGKHLRHLYSILTELGYIFSSSTTPVTGMWCGPIKKISNSLIELPVSGSYDSPGRILDSWSYRFSPTRTLTEQDYIDQFRKIMHFYADPSRVCVLNIYADPSQVYDWPGFFECMEMTSEFKKVSFSQFVREVSR